MFDRFAHAKDLLDAFLLCQRNKRLAWATHASQLLAMVRGHNRLTRTLLVITGGLVIAVSPLVGVIPGPGGIFVFAAGLVLVLQNSNWAKRNFAGAKRRWPRFGHYADMALRRQSFRRRQQRAKELALEQGAR